MRVPVPAAAGYTGGFLLPLLLSPGHSVRVFVPDAETMMEPA